MHTEVHRCGIQSQPFHIIIIKEGRKKKKTQLCYGLKDVSLFKLEIFVLIHRTDWYLQPVLSELVLFSFLKHVIFVCVFIIYKKCVKLVYVCMCVCSKSKVSFCSLEVFML